MFSPTFLEDATLLGAMRKPENANFFSKMALKGSVSNRTLEDMLKFTPEIQTLFDEHANAKGEKRQNLRKTIRLKLINEMGNFEHLSLEENLVQVDLP